MRPLRIEGVRFGLSPQPEPASRPHDGRGALPALQLHQLWLRVPLQRGWQTCAWPRQQVCSLREYGGWLRLPAQRRQETQQNGVAIMGTGLDEVDGLVDDGKSVVADVKI